ncbi:hypothetical protein D3C87_2165620 [compost metagenome]
MADVAFQAQAAKAIVAGIEGFLAAPAAVGQREGAKKPEAPSIGPSRVEKQTRAGASGT